MNQTAEQITETAETIKDLAMAALEGAAAHLHRTPLDSDLRAHVTRRIAANHAKHWAEAAIITLKRGDLAGALRYAHLATAETYALDMPRDLALARLTARDVLEEVQQMDAGAPAVVRATFMLTLDGPSQEPEGIWRAVYLARRVLAGSVDLV